MKDTRFVDFVVGLLFIVLGVVFFFLSDGLQSVKLGIGPAGFPKFVSVMLAILGATLSISTARKGFSLPKMKINKRPALLVTATIVLCFVYVKLVQTVGFVYLTPVFLFLLMLLFGNKRYVFSAVISIVTTVCVWLLFTKVFMIFLPACRLFG